MYLDNQALECLCSGQQGIHKAIQAKTCISLACIIQYAVMSTQSSTQSKASTCESKDLAQNKRQSFTYSPLRPIKSLFSAVGPIKFKMDGSGWQVANGGM